MPSNPADHIVPMQATGGILQTRVPSYEESFELQTRNNAEYGERHAKSVERHADATERCAVATERQAQAWEDIARTVRALVDLIREEVAKD